MKRFTGALMGALLILTALASVAEARWIQVDVPWERSNTTDGLYSAQPKTTGAAAKVDTTSKFNLDYAMPFPLALGWGGTTLDTVVVAKLVIYGDSTTASTINFKDASVVIQGSYGSAGTSWATVRTVATLNTDGVKFIEVPIYASNNAVSKQLYIDSTGDLSLFGRTLRAIITEGATGSAVPAMKCKLVYWTDKE